MLRLPGRGSGETTCRAGSPGLFVDRDGTLIAHRRGHVTAPEHIVHLEGVMSGLAELSAAEVTIAITSNQSGVSRGLLDQSRVLDLHCRVLDDIERAGGRVDASYLCPHQPVDDCWCRKPRLGMFRAAIADLAPDLTRSVVVGDAVCDVDAAFALGVVPALVLTGLGEKTARELSARGLLDRCRVFPSFVEVAREVVARGAIAPSG